MANIITLESKVHGTFTVTDANLTRAMGAFLPASSASLEMEIYIRVNDNSLDYSDVEFAGLLIILAECEYGSAE